MQYKISGTVMQTVDVLLDKGEAMYTEKGGMGWMRGDIKMETNTKGGIMKGLGRVLSGESFFMTTYTCQSLKGLIVFTPEFPGKIIDINLADGQTLICQKDAFMCAENSIKLEMHFRKKLGAGLFGGEGFILQKITGPGMVFLEIPGELREYELKEGETIRINPGHIGAFEPTVNYDITMVKGVANILFAGEGLFLATLTGPGKIWLQSMPLVNLAGALARYLPTKSS